MPGFSFVLDVRDPPEKVMSAMLDFSHRRPEIWPNLSAKIYQARSVGEYTADVTEGNGPDLVLPLNGHLDGTWGRRWSKRGLLLGQVQTALFPTAADQQGLTSKPNPALWSHGVGAHRESRSGR